MEECGVDAVRPDGLARADTIFSAVTADQSFLAARDVAPHLLQGMLFIDINSVSPQRKLATADLIEGRNGRYLDMAVMAPVHPRGHHTPVLVAGRDVEVLAPDLTRLDFDLRVVGNEVGRATAIKMVRSLFVKGLEAITVECLLAAEAAGCAEEIAASLATSFPGLGWPDFATYEFERTLKHGARRAAEMRESASTINDLGLHGALASAIADVQERMGAADVAADASLAEVLKARLKG
jgi:3-hydroxyisobutyrate dehydrogenase-like beta-hydroxyacid dehydrogenase